YDRPATRFAADFLGHSNLLDGVVDRLADGRVALRVGERLVPIGPSPDLPAAGAASPARAAPVDDSDHALGAPLRVRERAASPLQPLAPLAGNK
ncbi:hypothetical protein ACPWSF_24730, partial [Pandoraea pneumonica]